MNAISIISATPFIALDISLASYLLTFDFYLFSFTGGEFYTTVFFAFIIDDAFFTSSFGR